MVKAIIKWLRFAVMMILAVSLCACGKESVSAPTGLSARVTNTPSIVLDWNAAEGTSFYRVYRVEDDHTDYRFLCDVTTPGYTDETAKTGHIYGYKITAFSGATESEGCISQKLKVTTVDDNTPAVPSVPVITSVTRLDKHTNVIMFTADNTGCTYKIMRAENQDGPYTLIGETAEQVYYDAAATDKESCFYCVSASNGAVASDVSKAEPVGMNARSVFGVPVLMYHQFLTQEDVDSGITFGEYAIWASDFEQDLQWLQKNGYTTITTAELMAFMNGEKTPPEKPVIITIDDGYRGVYLNAYPLLQKYNMKAVFSVIGDRIDAATLEDPNASHADRLYCNWMELAELQKSGHLEMISHTATCHNDEDMTNIRWGANCAENESEDSFYKAALPDYSNISTKFKKHFGFSAYAMSYPYSSRSITSDRVWMKCGYRILYAGNSSDARKLATNYFAVGAGISRDSAVLRRVARMSGAPIWEYMREFN